MINKGRLIKLTRDLIRISSENPPGDEARIGAFVRGYLKSFGLKPKVYAFAKNRANIVAWLKGKDSRGALLITPHLDTVPRGRNWHFAPLSGTVKNGRLYGLGATDCKGNLACAIEAMQSLVEEKVTLGYKLIFAATADEESGSTYGLIPLLKKGILRPAAALVLDADDFNIVVAQKGLMHLKVRIEGKRCHGAYPWRGRNAIAMAVDILKEVKAQSPKALPRHKYLRPSTVNIGTIRGGDKVNVVADWCEFELDFRFLPGMQPKEILKNLRNIIRKHASKFKIEIESIQRPYSIKEEHPLIKCLKLAASAFKIKVKLKGSEGATTITFFQDKNIPALAWGFGSRGCAHMADEYVKIDNLYKGACALEKFLKTYKFNFTPLERMVSYTNYFCNEITLSNGVKTQEA